LSAKEKEADVGDGSSQKPIPQHPSDVELLNRYGSVASQTRRKLMQRIEAHIANAAVQARELDFRFCAITGTYLLPA
jgi:hypothetical protein